MSFVCVKIVVCVCGMFVIWIFVFDFVYSLRVGFDVQNHARHGKWHSHYSIDVCVGNGGENIHHFNDRVRWFARPQKNELSSKSYDCRTKTAANDSIKLPAKWRLDVNDRIGQSFSCERWFGWCEARNQVSEANNNTRHNWTTHIHSSHSYTITGQLTFIHMQLPKKSV